MKKISCLCVFIATLILSGSVCAHHGRGAPIVVSAPATAVENDAGVLVQNDAAVQVLTSMGAAGTNVANDADVLVLTDAGVQVNTSN